MKTRSLDSVRLQDYIESLTMPGARHEKVCSVIKCHRVLPATLMSLVAVTVSVKDLVPKRKALGKVVALVRVVEVVIMHS